MLKTLCVVYIVIAGLNVLAKTEEPYRAVIQKAQDLTLQQDRLQASQILIKEIKNQTPNKKATDELVRTLDEISTLFYTEKAQKLFEYAKSLFRETTNEAFEKFNEALQIEPNNVMIGLWIARFYLKQGKCDEALKATVKPQEIDPYYLPLELAKLQAMVCLQRTEDLEKENDGLKRVEAGFPVYYQLLMAQEAYSKKTFADAETHIQKAEQLDKLFPEVYFWKTHILEKEEKEIKEAASKYVKGCKTMAKNDYLKYELEPRTCIENRNFEVEYKSAIEQEESKKDL